MMVRRYLVCAAIAAAVATGCSDESVKSDGTKTGSLRRQGSEAYCSASSDCAHGTCVDFSQIDSSLRSPVCVDSAPCDPVKCAKGSCLVQDTGPVEPVCVDDVARP